MIPASMKAEKRFLVWRYSDEGKKLPHDPNNPRGKAIDSTDEKIWVDFETASKVVEAGGVDGLGFALGDGWAGIDLDDCRDPQTGELTEEAQRIIKELNSYPEISPSGTGIKIFVKAWLGKNHKRAGLEVYGYGRYFTVTGLHVEGTPTDIEARAAEVEALIAREFGVEDADDTADEPPTLEQDLPEDDGDLIEGNRNNALAKIGGSLRRLNFGDEELLAALLAYNRHRCRPPLADHEVKTIARSIGRYAPSKAERAIDWMNKQHAILVEAGKTIVITEREDPVMKRLVIDRCDFADIKKLYCDRPVHLKVNGKKIVRPLGDYWLNHAGRRLYRQLVFDPEHQHAPDIYNLWRGFAVQPKAGSWSAFRDHLYEIGAAGDDEVFRYFEGWLARLVQHPGKPGEVAVALRGVPGTGKGIIARALGHLCGQHFVHLSKSYHLTGHFNAHLQDAVLVFADEAVWGGDKTAEGALKALITERDLFIERKGRDGFMVRNCVHLLMATNNEWVAPMDLRDRRFLVVDVPSAHVDDHTYFTRIQDELKNGGYAAMLHDLLTYDLSKFNHRAIPKTSAGLHQKLLGMTPVQRWWFDKLQSGEILPAHSWPVQKDIEVPRHGLHDDYIAALQKVGIQRRATGTEFGNELNKLIPGWNRGDRGFKAVVTHRLGGKPIKFYVLPSLTTCRAYFEQLVKQPITWQPVEDTTPDEPGMPFEEAA